MLIAVLSLLWGLTLVSALVALVIGRQRGVSTDRLEDAFQFVVPAEETRETPEDAEPLWDRTFRPLLRWVATRLQRLVRPAHGTEQLLRAAGRPWRLDVVEFMGLKVGAAAVGMALMVALMIWIPRVRLLGAVGIIVFGVLGYLTPTIVMGRLAQRRRFEMQLALPDLLDLVTLSVEAGMGFDGAVARAVAHTRGPLSEELTRVLTEISQGRPRVEAFGDFATQAKIEEISLLVSTVHQAEQLGVSIGQSLRELGDQLREERAYRAREIIAKLPVKMLFPLLVFIFPALFIVILGPAAVMLRHSALMGGP